MRNRGYTYIELMISIAIFGILSAIIITGFVSAAKANVLRQNASLLVSDLQRIQTLAVNGGSVKACRDQTPVQICVNDDECTSRICELTPPPGGFGVYMNPDSGTPATGYTLFARLNADTVGYSEGVDPVIQMGNITFSDDVEVTVVNTEPHTVNDSGVVLFTAPRGTASSDATFCLSRRGLHRIVRIVAAIGQISDTSITGDCPENT